MKIIISADGRKLCASTGGQPLTSGSVGIEAAFVLSADYDGLAVTAVFRTGDVSVDVLLTGPSCTVPWEVLETSGHVLIVGVVGKNGSGEIVIPTIWGRVGMVECGTVAEGIDPQDPTPDIAAQLLQIAQATVERAETAETTATEAAEAAGESATAAGEAKTDAETAAQDAEAARQAIEDLSVEAHKDPDGPSVEKTVDPETGAVTLDFGIPPAPEVPVQSVNGKTGAVQLTLDDIPDGTDYARTTPAQVQQIGTNADDIEQLKTDVAKKYEKPNTGIPKTDLAAGVKASLDKADTALQPAALQPYRTAAAQDVIDNAQDDRLDDLEQATTSATVGPAPIVTFDASAADMPLKQVLVDIEPVQAGSGEPSPDNVRPISGWTGANIHVSPNTDAQDGTTYSIAFPDSAGTVYGGTCIIDANNAELRINKLDMVLNGGNSEAWQVTQGENNYFGLQINTQAIAGTDGGFLVCDKYKKMQIILSNTNIGVWLAKNGAFRFRYLNDNNLTEQDLRQYLANNPIHIVFEISSPIVYHFSTQQIVTTIRGENNIWADCGDVTVTYGAYLETLKASLDRTNGELGTLRICIAPIENGATASKAYAAGAYFFRNGSFCTALTAISSGAVFTLGTNYQSTTVAAALIALQS